MFDFDDRYQLDELAMFNARFAFLATWPFGALVHELSGGSLEVGSARGELERLLRRLA